MENHTDSLVIVTQYSRNSCKANTAYNKTFFLHFINLFSY